MPQNNFEHSETHRFALRECSACHIKSRLGAWNPVPPDIHEVCFACAHRYCESCSDCWATPEENRRAARLFKRERMRKEKDERERKRIAPCVAEIIERHGKLWDRRGEVAKTNELVEMAVECKGMCGFGGIGRQGATRRNDLDGRW
jgi:hypothetical protein